MRVLQVNKLYSPWIGGIETVVQDIAEGLLPSADVHCEVLVCRDRGPSLQSLVNGVPVTRVGSLGRFLSMPAAPGFPRQLAKMAVEFDMVHVHTPFPLPMFCDWHALKRRGVRLIVHHHSDIVRPVQRALLSPLASLERRFLESADKIIVTSDGLLKHSRTLGPYRDKCQVVPLSINLDNQIQPSEQDIQTARQRFAIADTTRTVLFAGRLVYYKGISYLIDAVRDLDLTLLVAGEGPLRPAIEKQVQGLGLSHKVRILGRVTDTELAALYSLASIFVLPSTEPSEAFGIVQLEAMARGLPVINTDIPSGVPSVSLHGLSGLTVSPADASALRDAIARLLADDDLRARFSANAKRRVQEFSRPAVLSKICSIYEELLYGCVQF